MQEGAWMAILDKAINQYKELAKRILSTEVKVILEKEVAEIVK